MASVVDERADEAVAALAGHLAQRRSLLAWTMIWCADGEPAWAAIWERATDAKAMINVLVAVRAIDNVALRSGAPYIVGVPDDLAIVRFTATREPTREVVDVSVASRNLGDLLRREFAWPSLASITTASGAR